MWEEYVRERSDKAILVYTDSKQSQIVPLGERGKERDKITASKSLNPLSTMVLGYNDPTFDLAVDVCTEEEDRRGRDHQRL